MDATAHTSSNFVYASLYVAVTVTMLTVLLCDAAWKSALLSCMATHHCVSWCSDAELARFLLNRSLTFAGNVLEACHALNGLALISKFSSCLNLQPLEVSTCTATIPLSATALARLQNAGVFFSACPMTMMKQTIILVT